MQRLLALNLPFVIHAPMTLDVDGDGTLNTDFLVQVIDHLKRECYTGHGKTFEEAEAELAEFMRRRGTVLPSVPTGNVVGGPIDGAVIPAEPDSKTHIMVTPYNDGTDFRSYIYARDGGRWVLDPAATQNAQRTQPRSNQA